MSVKFTCIQLASRVLQIIYECKDDFSLATSGSFVNYLPIAPSSLQLTAMGSGFVYSFCQNSS